MHHNRISHATVYVFIVIATLCSSCFLFHTRSDYTRLHECIRLGDTNCVVRELAAGSPGLKEADDGGLMPIHIASITCNVEMVNLLLDLGANIEQRAKEGARPLHFAAQEDCLELVKLLESQGADLEAKDGQGRTPLQRAKDWEATIVVSYLESREN